MNTWRRVLVVHGGALGDSVLVWPLLRALVRGGAEVTFAARGSHARLAARWVEAGRIEAYDADSPELTRLWSGPEAHSPGAGERYDAVATFLCDESTSAGREWLAAGAACWPGAQVVAVGAPGTASRDALWRRVDVARLGNSALRANADAPIVLHVGAGSPAKRWPLGRYIELAEELGQRVDAPVRLVAGEVEAERFTSEERRDFADAGGRLPADLDSLADELVAASLVVGNDSGPAHLAAQLGVPTLALFGPTDPAVWAPVGPLVRVLAPAAAGPVDALPVEAVVEEATDALLAGRFHRPSSDRPIITRLR